MPLPFNKQLDIKLLGLVKDNPILYNTKHLKYLDFDSREVVWQKIGDTLNRPAATFAGIQCQIHFGDFQEDKHKPGFIENLSEYLPNEYSTAWGVEKKIYREYKKHQGLSQLDAKVLYNKTARDLPTYGVTFFLVKEKQKGKKKLVPRLLGINAESILRLDEVTKEILQVWPLTHVKSYHAGKGETFTLNFGDYSEKEYSVKSRDALRIRDILQGYIDLIRKRMLARYHHEGDEGMVVCQDQVQAARGNVMEVVAHGAEKMVQQSFVGPSRLLPHEQGARKQHGTQLVTAQQAIINELAHKQGVAPKEHNAQHAVHASVAGPSCVVPSSSPASPASPASPTSPAARGPPAQLVAALRPVIDELAQQRAVKSSISMRTDMSKNSVRGLNKLNANAVQVVSLLTTPTDASIKEAQKIIESMDKNMPDVVEGLKETIAMQESETRKKKLQDELQELMDLVKKLASETKQGDVNPPEAVDTAMTIADLSMQMYFSLDPNNRRRSQQIEKSRASFKKSEKKEERQRRESFVAAATTALHSVEMAQGDMAHEYTGPPLDPKDIENLERSLVDKIGKLSATVALYLTAHADPNDIDYSASVTSMNTIKEIMPELVDDIQALGSSKSPADRKALLDDIKGLCAATKRVCMLSGSEDHEQIQEASNDYADVSSKLIFTLGRAINVDKRNEIIEIAKQVGDKTSLVLLKANELSTGVLAIGEAAAGEVDDAGIRVAHAARDLLACAQLTAPAIHEPHCRSALTAAAESLSSSTQHLANTWKPLVEEPKRQQLGDQLQNRTADLYKAIERLKDSFDDLDDNDLTMTEVDDRDGLSHQETERLKFLLKKSIGDVNDNIQAAEQELNEPMKTEMTDGSVAKAQSHLDSRLADLNAAVAALLAATADRDKVDYAAAARAVDSISSLLPAVAKDAKGAGADEAGRRALLQHTRALCAASRALCAAAGDQQPEALHSAVGQFTDATRRLRFVLPQTHDSAREEEIVSRAGVACGAASQALGGVQQLGARLGGRAGAELDARGARLADAAQALLATAQVAGRDQLLAAAEALAREGQQLQAACRAQADPADPLLQRILADHTRLQAELDEFKAAVDADRARLASSVAAAENSLEAAGQELDKPAAPLRGESVEQVQQRLSERLAALNAAVASLLAATADRDKVDYAAAARAVDSISSLLPAVAKDAKGAGADEAGRRALLQHTRALCAASRALCAAAGDQQPEALHSAVGQFANATRKLRFVLPQTHDPAREQEIVSRAGAACGAASQALGGVQQLGARLGGRAGAELDARGARLADAAQALLATAQVAGRDQLLAAAEALAREGQQLQAACRAQADPADPLLQRILADHTRLQAELDEFKAAVDADRARLSSSVAAAENSLEAAGQELDKPAAPLRGESVEQVQQRLSERLAALNAAVASLLAATADRDKVDYAAAARAVDSISSLLPAVAKDAKGAGADEAGRRALLQHTRALCAASRALCAAAGDQQPEALHSAVGQFADATRRLRFVLPQTHDPAREQEIVSRAGVACGAASQALGGVQQLGARLGGRAGAELDARGARLADAAQALLATAQVAGRDQLLAAAEALAREGQQLQAACRAQADPADPLLQRILADHTRLQAELDEFKAAVDADRARLASSVAAAENSLEAAGQELDKPAAPLRGESVEQVQQRLSERLAALNAAVASLLAATADRDKVDYAAAARAVDSISSLLPAVAKDAKGAGADEAGRRALLQHTRALCAASRALCAAAGDQQPEALHSAVGQFADATRKLRFVLPQTHDPAREQEVMASAAAACGAATQLVSDAQELKGQMRGTTEDRPGGAEGDILARGGRVSDATEALLAAAQLTAGNIELTSCRKALLKAAENLTVEGEGLLTACQTVTDPAHPLLKRVQSDNTRLQTEVDRLRGICFLPFDKQSPTLPKKVRPPVPKRLSSLEEPPRVAHVTPGAEVGDPARDFLQQLRSDEEQERTRAADKEKELHRQFVASVSDACKDIQAAKESLKAPGQASGQAPAGAGEVAARQRAVQEALALAGVHVAGLVSANYADKIDYEAASKSTKELPKLMKSIADDAKSLSSVISGDARKKFLGDMLGLCEASQTLCETAEKNREKLKEAATVFGDKSANLLREVSTDVDTALENEIISRAKAIGDSASRIASDASELASNAGGAGDATDGCAMDIRKTGAECVDAAGKLVYTAMLVSPSIHNTVCQDALVSSADGLSNKLKSFSETCKKADPSHAATLEKLSGEAGNLEKLLESLKKDIKGELGKRRIEKLVVEDSPLRQITMKILEDAKKRAGAEGGAQGGEQAAYASRLGAALRALDLAAARCARAPHDMEKHGSLQNAIQNLQMVLLQTRPKGPDKHDSHIVDLTEFIKDVSSEADKLHEVASGADVPRGKQVLEGVKEHCNQMHSEALQFISPTANQPSVDADTLDGLVEIDHFGQNCGNHVADITKLLDILPQDNCCSELRKQADILDDNCSFLRFATASAVSMARGAAGDEALADLQALQPRLPGLLPTAQATPDAAQSATATAGLARAVLAARRGQPAQLAPALAAYSTQLAPGSPAHRDRLLNHLNKLTGLLKALVACSNKHIATWQSGEGPELAAITEQILHELDNPVGTAVDALQRLDSLVSPSLVNKLLSPNEHVTTNDDKRELEHKMEKLSAFLTWMCSGTLPEENNPANLPTKMRDMIDSTIKLGSIARAMKPRDDPVQSQRIEESAQEMSYAAYALLKTGELVQQDLKHPDSRRKLLDACRSLSDAINRLNRSTPCKNKVKRECTEALGGLEARLALGPEARRRAPPASCLPYAACLDALDEHKDVIHKLQSEEKMSREEFMKSLNFISSAVCNSVDYAEHCNYLLSVSEQDKAVATEGLVDVPHVQKAAGAVHDLCVQVVRVDPDQAQEEVPTLEQRVQDLVQALDQAQSKVKDTELQSKVIHAKEKVETTATALCEAIRNGCQDKIAPLGMELLSATREARAVISLPALVPQVGDVTADTRARCDEISRNSKELLNKTQALIKEVSNSSKDDDDEEEMLTWTSFSHKKNVVDAFDKLFKSVRANGQKAGIVEVDQSEIDEAGAQKSYVQSQVEVANKWLSRPNCKADVKAAGEEAVRNVVEVGRKMSVELKNNEKEDMVNLITDTEELLGECSKKYDQEKYSQLSERLKELRKAIEQGVVTWIVEDFLEGEPPLADLDILVDSEKDMNKRELILERKIAELLAQLARVNKTANFVAHAGLAGPTHNKELAKCREETELLAPLLVKAAQERIASPDNQAIVEHYKDLLAKYTESLSKVQELCDQAVDPTEFVQTAGETMQRLREESTDQDDLQKCDYTSKAITGLAERVMCVSLSSSRARREPELQRALAAAQRRLAAARAPPARRSALPDWRHTTAEIMRTTGEVEAVLVGENIFEKQSEVDQPIFAAARGLHAAVRSWRARDNGVVAGARRLAVLMAHLSGHMHEDKKHELIMTSKSIVMESHEVAMLARKLAHECTDLRIKNNLLQTCERIPTISGQLKMLTTVKGSSLGHQGSEEDKEAMDMLVGNAENLMMSIQEVVKAAASASVKIASQRGPKMRWVRKAYY